MVKAESPAVSLRIPHLVSEEERLQGERVLQGANRDEMRPRPEHETSDADHARHLHGSKQEGVRFFRSGAADRPDVIALLVEDGVDLGEIHELLDLYRSASLRGDRFELSLGHGHEVPARHREASHHIVGLNGRRRVGHVGRGPDAGRNVRIFAARRFRDRCVMDLGVVTRHPVMIAAHLRVRTDLRVIGKWRDGGDVLRGRSTIGQPR